MDANTFWLGFSSGVMALGIVLLIAVFASQAWDDSRKYRQVPTLLPGPMPPDATLSE